MGAVKYSHTNLITTDWKKISKFYMDVFDCIPLGPIRKFSGKAVEDGTSVESANIEGVHLLLPGFGEEGPTLEVFQYSNVLKQKETFANTRGYTHIAFEVSSLDETCRNLVKAGGWMLGKLARQPVEGVGVCIFVYARDPDKNIIEIQSWE